MSKSHSRRLRESRQLKIEILLSLEHVHNLSNNQYRSLPCSTKDFSCSSACVRSFSICNEKKYVTYVMWNFPCAKGWQRRQKVWKREYVNKEVHKQEETELNHLNFQQNYSGRSSSKDLFQHLSWNRWSGGEHARWCYNMEKEKACHAIGLWIINMIKVGVL